MSGLTLEAKQRLQMNFYIKKDDLYNWIQNDYGLIVPLTFVRREALLSEAQVEEILGDLITANKAKTILLIILVIVGVILLLLGAFLMYKWRQIKKFEGADARDGKVDEQQNLVDTHE